MCLYIHICTLVRYPQSYMLTDAAIHPATEAKPFHEK